MTNAEDVITKLKWLRNLARSGEYVKLCRADAEALNNAIEPLEKQNCLISETLEIVGEYVDDCICTYDVEVFGKSVKMIPVETIHMLLERIEKEATERSVEE